MEYKVNKCIYVLTFNNCVLIYSSSTHAQTVAPCTILHNKMFMLFFILSTLLDIYFEDKSHDYFT